MEFRILGPLEVLRDGEPLALGGAKQRALLAVLLLHANEPVSTDRLVDALWGEKPPATATHTIRVYVSNLRKVLGPERLVTRALGYLVQATPDELDLNRFEHLLDQGRRELSRGNPEPATRALREALSLWRGAPLADFRYEAFAQSAIARLEELRLVALEERIEADLALGEHAALVAELQALVAAHRLRERPRGQLMLALYRSGRQAEALEVFQETRRLLVGELGIEPSPALQQLERGILQHDPMLGAGSAMGAQPARRPERAILVASDDDELLAGLVRFAEPLARSPQVHELILACALPPESGLSGASAALNERRDDLLGRGVVARAAAFTSTDAGADLVRLASEQDVDLALLDGGASFGDGGFSDVALAVLADAPCDVALLFDRPTKQGAVLVPFGGGEHDWAALELGAWCARALQASLTLLGTEADEVTGRRDASRLLAHAALGAQQLVGVATESMLSGAGTEGVLDAAERARLLVVGLPDDWAERGLSSTRAKLVERAEPPVVAVRRGLRPGGLAPRETLTHFTWSLSGAYAGHAVRTPSAME